MTENKTNPAESSAGSGRKTIRKAKKPGAAIGSAMSYPPDLRLIARAGGEPENGLTSERQVTHKLNPSSSLCDEGVDDSSVPVSEKRPSKTTKTEIVLKALRRKRGATLAELQEITGWQAHSVRGFLSGTVRKKLGLIVTSEMGKDGVRRYRIDSTPRVG